MVYMNHYIILVFKKVGLVLCSLHKGDSYNGSTSDSKPLSGGPIPSSPAVNKLYANS